MKYVDPVILEAGETDPGPIRAFKVINGDVRISAVSEENPGTADLANDLYVLGDFVIENYRGFTVVAGSAGKVRAFRKKVSD